MENLAAAFAGELQARNKYLAFAKKAEDEGYPQVARLFRAAAQAELIHAQNHFRAMGEILTTAENLGAADYGREFRSRQHVSAIYRRSESRRQPQGARRPSSWAWEVEQTHEALYREALADLEQTRDEDYDYYVCPVCGHTHKRGAPDKCPVCGTPGSRFERVSLNRAHPKRPRAQRGLFWL